MAFADLHLNRVDRYKMLILAILVAVSLVLEIVVHWYLRIEVVYSHFFYIPVVLAAFWYGVRGCLVAAVLGGVLILDSYFITGSWDAGEALRAFMLVVVALVIGLVADYMRREQERVITEVTDAALREGTSRGRIGGSLEEWKIRVLSSANVKKMKEERNVQGLVNALRHRDPQVQYEAAEALGELRDTNAVTPLIAALDGDRYSGVRWKAAEALARIGEPAVAPLIRALSHPDEDVRWKAAIALGEIRDPQAISPLIYLLDDEDRFVQSRAAYALGGFGADAVEPLIAALDGGGPPVRWGAALVLGKIGDSRAIDPLLRASTDPTDRVRTEVLCSLIRLGDQAITRMLMHLATLSLQDKSAVLKSINELPGSKALDPLLRVAENADDETREMILTAAGRTRRNKNSTGEEGGAGEG